MKTIYIAGPMRGIQYFNFPAFDAARDKLESEGWNVISPADLDREIGFNPCLHSPDYDWNDLDIIGFDLNAAINRDVEAICKSDAIYLLNGWEKSKGARAEKALAEWRGLEILFECPEEDILVEALRLTSGDRQASYGPPDQDFKRTAVMWGQILGCTVEARHVALCMIALKISRETHQRKRDNWVDIAGYARCGSLIK